MKPFGLQLYTLRKPFAEDPIGTLERIKATGYDEVEFAASLDLDFAPFAAKMQEIALDCPSVHVGLADMTSRPERVLEVAKTLGCRFIVMPFVDPNTADWPVVVRELETFAKQAAGEGFTTCYHHHHFEFDASKGTRPFDILLTADPALVFFELDVYWLKTGGEDPVAMIDKLAGRVKLLHLKDALPDGPMTDLGLGNLDFPAIIAAGRKAGVAHMFVENDIPPKPYWPSVETSAEYLKTQA
jgi:sugar phosphate isomerase/epimerase